MEAIVPVLRKSLQIGAIGFDKRESGVGDVYLGPPGAGLARSPLGRGGSRRGVAGQR